jgi:hypothetical protein
MKNAVRFFLRISIALFSIVVPVYSLQNPQKELPDYFYQPLEYSQKNFRFFLERVYNHSRYPQDFLALNFIHVVSGTALAPQSNQPRRFIKQILDLFDQKLLQIYINPYACLDMLTELTEHISRFCNVQKEKSDTIDAMKHCMGNYLVDHFNELKTNPDATLTNLAQELYTLIDDSDSKDISIRELQHAIHHFMGRVVMNLIWSPSDQQDTWLLTKSMSHILETYVEKNMIDSDMFDDLLWTLLKRYGYFVSLSASDLDRSFFEKIQQDLKNEKASLWLLQEREAYIATKLEYLQQVLMEAELAARMRAAGHSIPMI